MNDISVYSILTRAFSLIEKEENFCQRSLAMNRDFVSVEVKSPQAVRFCGIGTLCRAQYLLGATDLIFQLARLKIESVARNEYNLNVSEVNDEIGHKAILNIFTKAIKSERDHEICTQPKD